MAGVKFFTNWELWEQLTFVLAASIVLVFFIGWIKLWWAQRLLAKYALLDEEKKQRQMELRKSGIPAGRRADIPFGVRAIQSGIEVEGIWISRPVTPQEVRSASKASSRTTNLDGEPRPENKGKGVMGSTPRPSATVTEVEPTPRPSPSPRPSPTSSVFDQSSLLEIGGMPSLGPQYAYLQPHTSQRPVHDNPNSATANRYLSPTTKPKGTAAGQAPFIETYIPTSSTSSVNSFMDDGSGLAHLRFPFENRNRSAAAPVTHYRSPLDESDLPMPSATQAQPQNRYVARVRAEARGNMFDNNSNTESDRTLSYTPIAPMPVAASSSASRPSLASTRPTPVRVHTEVHQNTSTRRVNPGFEVLPAGTFVNRASKDGSDGIRSPHGNSATPGLAR
ncbi:hypothetical protein GGS20DRAFT_547166 [Poronia punctata]|nr:hypothetical protein GGS20DRAFT_547166 [Poronia punctata]